MASICFISTYKPIMCGIADYMNYITQASPPGKWGVISFDPGQFGAPYTPYNGDAGNQVLYTIPGRTRWGAEVIERGMVRLGFSREGSVAWFQHEFGIWPDGDQFVTMLRNLTYPKIVTFHTLHFQSSETSTGLHSREYDLLGAVLPNADAITVFSKGTYRAVTSAFPQYTDKVYILRHGIHSYPLIASLGRPRAKYELYDYLVNRSDLDSETKRILRRERPFVDPDVFMVGQTGFLCPLKQSEILFDFADNLQSIVKDKRVVSMRIGHPREKSHEQYATELQKGLDGHNKFILNTWLPPKILPMAQRAFDLNLYWPKECTQSGILAHALGAGAIIGGKNIEGTGETLRACGQFAENSLGHLLLKARDLVLDSEIGRGIEERTRSYADEFSWEKQAMRHFSLARKVLSGRGTEASSFAHSNRCNSPFEAQEVLP